MLIIFFVLSWTVSAADVPTPALRVEPDSVYTHDDVKVLFVLQNESKDELFLYRTDESGTPLKLLATLNDEGAQGDVRKSDQVFTRRLQFKESRPKTLYFRVFDKEKQPVTTQTASLLITSRPTFVQTLEKVWNRILAN